MDVSTWANVAEAFGTVSAVVVALFLRVYLVHRHRPDLRVEFDRTRGGVLEVDEEDTAIYFRPCVVNARKKNTARNVQVLLTHVSLDDDRSALPNCPSRNLGWSDVPDESLRIAAGGWRRFDALVVLLDKQTNSSAETVQAPDGKKSATYCVPNLKVYGEGWPPPARHRIYEAGTYQLHLIVSADDCDVSYWTMSFRFSPTSASNLNQMRAQVP